MFIYQPGIDADLLLSAAWLRIYEAGDLPRFVSDGAVPLTGFLGLCMAPRITILDTDAKGP